MPENNLQDDFRTGFVSLVGKPNVGKSTLLNALLGQKVSIVSRKPQTTRNRILGIHNEADCQILFLDTPGLHQGEKALNRFMLEQALSACDNVDLILFLVEPGDRVEALTERFLEALSGKRVKTLLVINKIDLFPREKLLPVMQKYNEVFGFTEIIPVSALKGEGLEELLAALRRRLPKGPPLYPPDMISDLPERFFAAEIIREQILKLTHKEIPYGTAVYIETFNEKDDIVEIAAVIVVERETHKKIVLGHKGKMIRMIGENSRRGLEEFLGTRVYLKTFVKVVKNWTRSPGKMKEFGYHD
ncbi:MAG: GTPase Era [Deltaproteobacteria bacterium]|nr:GTPase Era [Deltaproteobacteria bacterium]